MIFLYTSRSIISPQCSAGILDRVTFVLVQSDGNTPVWRDRMERVANSSQI